jgi:hypothetical protein
MHSWLELTRALHLAGDHPAELDAAVRARTAHPDHAGPVLMEIRALVGLGRIREALERVEASRRSAPPHGPSPGQVLQEAALELGAHGQPDAASSLIERGLNWYLARTPAERQQADYRRELARASYLAGAWDDAERYFTPPSLTTWAAGDEPPASWLACHLDHGMLGAIAARRGDRRAAEEMARWLDSLHRPGLLGRPRYWQACISALLGDAGRALGYLQEALDQGIPRGFAVHTDVHFAALRHTSAFRTLLLTGA